MITVFRSLVYVAASNAVIEATKTAFAECVSESLKFNFQQNHNIFRRKNFKLREITKAEILM